MKMMVEITFFNMYPKYTQLSNILTFLLNYLTQIIAVSYVLLNTLVLLPPY